MKTLVILSYNTIIKNYFKSTIQSILGKELKIFFYSLEEAAEVYFKPDLVVTTGVFLLKEAKKIFPQSEIICGKRVLTGYNLEKVFLIPEKSNILVVTTPVEMYYEIIADLKEIGVLNMNYLQYDPHKEVDYDSIDYVITPGMSYLCSNSPKEIIDLGFRALSITTFSNILNYFGFSMKHLETFERNYIQLHIDTCRKVTNSLELYESYHKNQSLILNRSTEGILELDSNNDILLANPMLNKIFGPTSELLVNKSFLTILHELNKKCIDDHCSVITSYNEIELYCTKDTITTNRGDLYLYTFKKVALIRNLEMDLRENYRNKGFNAKYNFSDIWGENIAMANIKTKAYRFSQNDRTILITGESGTGKEILAQSIHNTSKRSSNCFVGVNITSIPDNLIESELFGYAEGAFTGAKKSGKLGFFEIANKGTLFIDEIGDASPRLQAILLRVLEERQITPVGSERNIPIDVRIIAATNKNLKEMVEEGTFRNDLYYRLSVLSIKTIPLKFMKSEVISFIEKYLKVNYKTTKVFNCKIKEILLNYDWPGNFRELRNVVDYIYYSSENRDEIISSDLPQDLYNNQISDFLIDPVEFNKLADNPTLLEILLVLHQQFPNSIGRNKILEILLNYTKDVSEHQLKNYLNELADLKLVSIGNTKQGTSITDKGEAFLNYSIF